MAQIEIETETNVNPFLDQAIKINLEYKERIKALEEENAYLRQLFDAATTSYKRIIQWQSGLPKSPGFYWVRGRTILTDWLVLVDQEGILWHVPESQPITPIRIYMPDTDKEFRTVR